MNQNIQTTTQNKPEQNIPNQNIEDDEDWEQYSDNDDFDDSNSKPESSTSKPQIEYKESTSSSYKPRYKKGNRYSNNYEKDYKDYNYHGSKKYHKDRPHNRNNNYYHTTEVKETTNKYSNDFVNMNSNYSKKPGDKRYNNTSSNTNSHYGWGRQGYNSSSKREEEDIKKPMFINSKLGNNINPEGNFVDLEPVKDALPKFNLIPGGEIKPSDNGHTRDIANAKTPTNTNDTEIEYTTDKYYGKSFGYSNYDDSKNYYKGGKYNDRNYNGYSNRGKYKERVGGKYLNQPERSNDYKKYSNNSNTNRGKGYNNGNKFDMYEKSSSYGGGTRK